MKGGRTGACRLHDRALAGLFLLGLAAPPALMLTGGAGGLLAENRPPAPPPAWKPSRDFPGKFDAFFADRFGLRNDLVRAHGWFALHGLGVSPTPDVVLGRDGWLYYAGCDSFADFQGRRPFADEELERWRRALERRRDRLAQKGIAYLFVVAPNKQTIYPEHLPDALNRPGRTRLDQLADHLRAHSDVPFLDLRPALRRAKEREPVYRPGDSHWNDLGAHAAYERILEALAGRRPPLRPWPRGRFTATPAATASDLGMMLGLPSPPRDEWWELAPRTPRRAALADPGMSAASERRLVPEPAVAFTVADPALPSAVVLYDSFGLAVRPFLAEHFRRSLFLWRTTLEPDVLDRERPDLVIQEMCERFLQGAPPFGPPDVEDAGR
jgi:hypothetical protein